MSRFLVIGKTGQLAQAFADVLPASTVFLARDMLDLSNIDKIDDVLSEHAHDFDVLINTAAYTAVDKAESDQDMADLVNHRAVDALAKFCALNDKFLIHYSTDYVFHDDGDVPLLEEADKPKQTPRNIYGQTKLSGEQAIIASGCHYLILRTSWVYSHVGGNFVKTMLRLGTERDALSIVGDQVGAPTYAPDLAAQTLVLLGDYDREAPIQDIVHMASGDYMSWYEFAVLIFESAKQRGIDLAIKDVQNIPSSAYPTPAPRPLNSRLSIEKARGKGVSFPTVKQSLDVFFSKGDG